MTYLDPKAGQAREPGAASELDTLLDALPRPAVADLAVSVGTADGTVADVGAAFSQATLNNNFRDVADKVNAILAALRAAGIITT